MRSLLVGLLPALALAAAPPADNPNLLGTRWSLLAIDGAPVTAVQAADPHLQLHPGTQKLSAFGGCNRLQGRYTQHGIQLALTALASTRMACAPAVMQQEQRVIELLGTVDGYRIEGQVLSLLQGDAVRLSFKAAAPKSPK
ncbi:MAG TPA: META domain-containing protein [Rhizobacter sp.]|nr:META domain-containing protein [Rhizobacter sp.]